MKKSTMQKSRRNSLAARPAGQEAATSQRSHRDSSYHDSQPVAIRVWDGVRYVTVGTLYADGVFHKRLKASHILQRPPAIALQADAVSELARLGCSTIRAEIIGGKTLVTSFEAFLREGFPLNRGYGEQIALPLSRWQNANAMQIALCAEIGSKLN